MSASEQAARAARLADCKSAVTSASDRVFGMPPTTTDEPGLTPEGERVHRPKPGSETAKSRASRSKAPRTSWTTYSPFPVRRTNSTTRDPRRAWKDASSRIAWSRADPNSAHFEGARRWASTAGESNTQRPNIQGAWGRRPPAGTVVSGAGPGCVIPCLAACAYERVPGEGAPGGQVGGPRGAGGGGAPSAPPGPPPRARPRPPAKPIDRRSRSPRRVPLHGASNCRQRESAQ